MPKISDVLHCFYSDGHGPLNYVIFKMIVVLHKQYIVRMAAGRKEEKKIHHCSHIGVKAAYDGGRLVFFHCAVPEF